MEESKKRRPALTRSDIMRRVRGRDTGVEMIFRRALRAKGYQYRLHVADLPGTPDLTFRRARLVVFVDGDFWHGAQWGRRRFASLEAQFSKAPNSQYWTAKLRKNIERDLTAKNHRRRTLLWPSKGG